MVNCGVRMVNCRPLVTKHARRKIPFFTGSRAPVCIARERIESEVVYADYIVPPPPPSSSLPASTYLSPVLLATYTEPASRVHTLCTFVTVSFLLRPERALISSSSKESACNTFLLAGRLSRLFLSFFSLGRISMPTRDVGVRTRKGGGGGGGSAKRERGSALSRG